ncbi:MAG: helix-turn-helix transcriptional regulator [Clostridiales Family XIII bacterium]|nr:helix-turn-helix transcriptional regulator [Clostridiales Family XIII bacterium]
MREPLLHLVKKCFGFTTVTMSSYTFRQKFDGVLAVGGEDISMMKAHYVRNFQQRDPFAAHIGRVCEENPTIPFLQSGKVFADNCFSNEYSRFIRHYGYAWALSMPIDKYRLTVYKENAAVDFSAEECDAMELLASLIRKRHPSVEAGAPANLGAAETMRDPDRFARTKCLGLSERELHVAHSLADGKSYQETADGLFISINTVRTHVCNIYRKLGIDNQYALYRLLR